MKTELTYGEITALVNSGFLNVTARTLPTADRYNVFDFKQKLREAVETKEKRDKELVRECGIEDAAAFDARNEELRGKVKNGTITEEERRELDGNRAKLETVMEQRREMLSDKVEIDVRQIGCGSFFSLCDENAAVSVKGGDGKESGVNLIPEWVESLLFGKLWTAPEDEKSAEENKTEEV